MIIEEGTAGNGQPLHSVEVIADLAGVTGGHFFFVPINRATIPMMTREYANNSLYVTMRQPPFPGAKKKLPPIQRADRTSSSAVTTIPQHTPKGKKKCATLTKVFLLEN